MITAQGAGFQKREELLTNLNSVVIFRSKRPSPCGVNMLLHSLACDGSVYVASFANQSTRPVSAYRLYTTLFTWPFGHTLANVSTSSTTLPLSGRPVGTYHRILLTPDDLLPKCAAPLLTGEEAFAAR